jgi:hypothetical protein
MGVGGGLVGVPDSKRPQAGSGGGRDSESVVTATDGRGAVIGTGYGQAKGGEWCRCGQGRGLGELDGAQGHWVAGN